jgi:hypothetical protein
MRTRRTPASPSDPAYSLFRKVLEGFPEAAVLMRDRIAERANEAADELYAVRGLLDPPRQ